MATKIREQPPYTEWGQPEWQDFTPTQFFREDDGVEYFLEDEKEIYHP